MILQKNVSVYGFQSTLPARGATVAYYRNDKGGIDFNPRSPRGERPGPQGGPGRPGSISIHAPREGSDSKSDGRADHRPISIHAPREGSDNGQTTIGYGCSQFQSTLPARGATLAIAHHIRPQQISIHAPREGSDRSSSRRCGTTWDFNPRSPRGERHYGEVFGVTTGDFNPRSPRGERPFLHGPAL